MGVDPREPPSQASPEPAGRPGSAGPAGASPVYTRTGDDGRTALRGGQRVPKHDARVEAYGTVDELNACVGLARELARRLAAGAPALSTLDEALLGVQHRLFEIGGLLASSPGDRPSSAPRVDERDVVELERQMDACSAELAPLSSFVLPGGCELNAVLHLARTVCRRAERRCVAVADGDSVELAVVVYLNRLGDALFVWGRWASSKLGAGETPWHPRR